MGRAFKYAGKYRKFIYWASFIILLGTISGVIPYYFVNLMLVKLLKGGAISPQELIILAGGAGAAIILGYFLQSFGLKLSHVGAFGTLYNMRVRFAKDMTNHSFGDISAEGTGKYKKAFVEDINNVERLIAHFIPEGLPNIFLLVTVLILIFNADYRMGWLSVAILPLGAIPTIIMFKAGMKMMPEYYEVKSHLNDTIIEYIAGMEVVKVFGVTDKSYSAFTQAVDDNRDKTLNWWKRSWPIQSIVGASLACTILFVLPFGTILYLRNEITLEVLIFCIMLNLSLSGAYNRLINFLPFFATVDYAVRNLEDLFVKESVCCGLRTQLPKDYSVKFEDITFSYTNKDGEKGKDVIHDLNISLKPDTLTAFVGESGSGKSTLAKLLMHFWEIDRGGIYVGDIDIREFTNDVYMSMVSYVSQDTHLFSGTIAENIGMGKMEASREEIIEVAKASACHDFIMKLENGYDTQIGELGGKLSGGEKQRITIARAILKDAPIIILDEATAFADAQNEAFIQTALNELLKGKTAIVIAHRLNTIINADNIVVLEQGMVDSQGTHDELLKHSPLYQKLWYRSERALDWNMEV